MNARRVAIQIQIDEADRQLILLALASLALLRRGFDGALGRIADNLQGREMFDEFKRCNKDLREDGPEPWPSRKARV
jgi:hypothetical protein